VSVVQSQVNEQLSEQHIADNPQLDFTNVTVVDALPANASVIGYLNFTDDGSVYFQSVEQNMQMAAEPTVSAEVQSEVNDEPAVSVVQSGVNEQEADEPIVGHAATRKRLRKEPVWKRNKCNNCTHTWSTIYKYCREAN